MRKVYLLKTSALLAYVALIGSVTAIVREAPLPSLLVFLLALIAGFILDRRSIQQPVFNPLFLLISVITGIIISLVGVTDENFFGRALSILLIIISAKLVSPKKSRDILQIFLLNLLVVAAAAVARYGLEFALLVIIETFVSVTGLVFVYGSSERQAIGIAQVWSLVRWSSLITLSLIPATILFYLILPRPSGVLFAWGRGSIAKSGFSDRVTPGSVEQIKIDPSTAFRVKWLKGKQTQNPLWRGIVYDIYYQGAWENRYRSAVDFPKKSTEIVQYEILLEPTVSKYLPSLGLPAKILLKNPKPVLVSGYTILIPEGIQRRTIYRLHSYPMTDIPAELTPGYYLEIPKEVKQQLAPLAKRLVRKTVFGSANAVASFLKKGFSYNLSPGKTQGDPVVHFLFSSKKGHCEYFASAMALLLRTIGIPTRIVGGYLGGDWNELGQYYLVKQSDAHTWVEVWIEERGWVTFDPTPGAPFKQRPPLVAKVFKFIDFLRLKWYYWVIDYDIGRQMDLASKTALFFQSFRAGNHEMKLTFETANLIKKFILFLVIVGSILILKIAWSYFHDRPRTPGELFVNLFQRYGYHKKPGVTLQELADRVAKDDSLLGQKALTFVKYYYHLEYGQKGKEETLYGLIMDMKKDLKKKRKDCGQRKLDT